MATDSSHRVIMGETVLSLFQGCLSDLFIVAGNEDMHESPDEIEVRLDPTTTHRLIMGEILWTH